jgi:hypothetical protein
VSCEVKKNKNSQFVCGGPLPPTSGKGAGRKSQDIALASHANQFVLPFFSNSLKYNFNELTRKRAYFKVNHHVVKTVWATFKVNHHQKKLVTHN